MHNSERCSGETRMNSSEQKPMTVLLTPEQAAAALGVTAGTLSVWRCTKRYKLRYVKIGALVRYRQTDVEQFIASRVTAA
jgi:excisionase family DNA binding protein